MGEVDNLDLVVAKTMEQCFNIITKTVEDNISESDNDGRINLHLRILMNICGNGVMQVTLDDPKHLMVNSSTFVNALSCWFEQIIHHREVAFKYKPKNEEVIN